MTDLDTTTPVTQPYQVRVWVQGSRNGEPFPPIGGILHLDDDEAADYLLAGYIVPFEGELPAEIPAPAAPVIPRPAAPEIPAPPAPLTPAKPIGSAPSTEQSTGDGEGQQLPAGETPPTGDTPAPETPPTGDSPAGETPTAGDQAGLTTGDVPAGNTAGEAARPKATGKPKIASK